MIICALVKDELMHISALLYCKVLPKNDLQIQ